MTSTPRAALLIVLLVAPALAGCLADPAVEPGSFDVPPQNDAPMNATGTLRVLAVTPELSPVADAVVEVGDRLALTKADGFALLELEAGNHSILVTKEGWRSARLDVAVTANNTTDVQAKLFPGDEVEAAPANQTYQAEHDHTGMFQCSLTFVILTGDCLLIADYVVNETLGLPIQPGDNTEDYNSFEFPLDAGWESVVVEMVWDAPFAPIAEKMQIALEPSEAPTEGHAPKYARAAGTSPLSFTVHKGVPHPTASVSADGEAPDMPNRAGGEVVMARAYVLGELHNPAGTNFLGVGAAYGHQFQIYATVFYGEPAPDGFSRIPG